MNGLSIVRDGSGLLAGWRAPEGAASYILECTAQRPPSWTNDLTLTIAAGAVVRDGERVSVNLPAEVDALVRCRVAAELNGVLGVRSNAANVPQATTEEPDDAPAAGDGATQTTPDQPSGPVPNPNANLGQGQGQNPNLGLVPNPNLGQNPAQNPAQNGTTNPNANANANANRGPVGNGLPIPNRRGIPFS